MICPRCKSEVGSQSRCPYCGTVLQTVDYTIPVNQAQKTVAETEDRHLANVDTWSLIQAVLLSGIFLTNILELVLMLAN